MNELMDEKRNGSGPKAPAARVETERLPDPEVSPPARRRVFSAAYKRDILRRADACGWGELGALLRREGLYSSHLTDWRRQLAAGGLAGLEPKKRGPKPSPDARRIAELDRELARTRKRLAQAEAIIDAQKKLAELMSLADGPASGGPS